MLTIKIALFMKAIVLAAVLSILIILAFINFQINNNQPNFNKTTIRDQPANQTSAVMNNSTIHHSGYNQSYRGIEQNFTSNENSTKTVFDSLIICSQPFLLDIDDFPSEINFSIYLGKSSENNLNPSELLIKIDEQTLEVSSVTFNENTKLYDISAHLPFLDKGKYILRVFYDSQESVNFKGINVYQYNGNFTFIQLTDIHYNPPTYGYANQLNTTLQIIKNTDPDFVIMTGDIASSEANYQRFYDIAKSMDFDTPIFFVNGNHEKESTTALYNAILYMGSKEINLGVEYPFTFNFGNYHFVGLDTGVLPFASSGNISDAQYNWLKDELYSNQNKKIITFCHHPLFLQNNPDSAWINYSVSQKVRQLLSDFNVTANFAGHFHRSDISILNGVTYFTTVSAHNDTHWVGSEPYPPAGFRTIEVVNDEIVRTVITETFSYYTGESLLKKTDSG